MNESLDFHQKVYLLVFSLLQSGCVSFPAGQMFIGVHVQDSMIEEAARVELGLTCAEICRALDRGTNEMQQKILSRSILEEIDRLET